MLDKLRRIREEKAAEDRGFTLIELLVVVVIIGILIAIAIPLYLNYQKGAKDKSTQSDLRQAVASIQQCYTDNANAYPASITWTTGLGTPAPTACGNDKINLSSGTTMTYTLSTDSLSFQLRAWNSGGNKNANTAGNYYSYDSANGGSIQ